MIGVGVYAALLVAQAQMEAERREVLAIQSLPADQQPAAYKAMDERREKARLEAIEERRHRDLCDAIRYSRRFHW